MSVTGPSHVGAGGPGRAPAPSGLPPNYNKSAPYCSRPEWLPGQWMRPATGGVGLPCCRLLPPPALRTCCCR
eukprot:13823886-Heterocapsa_arctica.AAC.1